MPSTNAVSAPLPSEDQSSALRITPLTGRIGAQIDGVRLDARLPEGIVAEIRQALLRHKVIFFRGQQHLDEAAHEDFTERLGPLLVHPARKALEGTRATLHLDSEVVRANTWHADLTFMNAFPQLSVLRGVEIPAVGGDTLWANTVTAYEHLPPLLKPLADQLWAVHSNVFDNSSLIPAGSAEGKAFQAAHSASKIVETEHPVVHVHPETGERAMLLGQFVKRLVGFNAPDSARLLAILHDHATSHENIVRWRWAQGDVVIWDNRATLHKAIDDYGTQRRIVRRVTASGSTPVSTDGRRSVTREANLQNPTM